MAKIKVKIKEQVSLIDYVKGLSSLQFKRLERWVNALKSGKYKQGHATLCFRDKYCCLGVACDISNRSTGLKWGRDYELGGYGYGGSGESAFLRKETIEYFGFKDQIGFSFTGNFCDTQSAIVNLANLNDVYNWSFKKIGNLVGSIIKEAKRQLEKEKRQLTKKK